MSEQRTAVILVPGPAYTLAKVWPKPRTVWEHDVLLAPKWRYTLVKPGSWRGLLRGRLPRAGTAATKIVDLMRWNQSRWPGAEIFVVIPAGRRIWWRQVTELAAALSHTGIEAIEWSDRSRQWPDWMAKRQPGDLILVDDSIASGARLWRRLASGAGNGCQLVSASTLLPTLRSFSPQEHRLIIAPATQHDQLLSAGIGEHELAASGSSQLSALRRELASRQPSGILLIQPAARSDDLLTRFQLDDDLTQMTRLLDQYGYGVRVIGAPDELSRRGSWPVIEWTAGQRSRLPAGWEHRHATLRHARRALQDPLSK